MPVEAVAATYKLTSDTALVTGKTYYTKSGTKYNAVASPSVDNIATYYEVDVPAGEEYTSYVLGEGSINFEDLGAKVPYEMSRDPAKNGGQDTLYTRQRKVFGTKVVCGKQQLFGQYFAGAVLKAGGHIGNAQRFTLHLCLIDKI